MRLKLKSIFDTYVKNFNYDLGYLYTADISAGIEEVNQTVKFFEAAKQVCPGALICFNELQIADESGNTNSNHIDGVIIDKNEHEIFLIESKKFTCSSKPKSLYCDAIRAQYIVKDKKIPWDERLMFTDFQKHDFKVYEVLLADLWVSYHPVFSPKLINNWDNDKVFGPKSVYKGGEARPWIGTDGESWSSFDPATRDNALKNAEIAALSTYRLFCYCCEIGCVTKESIVSKKPKKESSLMRSSNPAVSVNPLIDLRKAVYERVDSALNKDILKILIIQHTPYKSVMGRYTYFIPVKYASTLQDKNDYKSGPYCFYIGIDSTKKEVRLYFSGKRSGFKTTLSVSVHHPSWKKAASSEYYNDILQTHNPIKWPLSVSVADLDCFQKQLEEALAAVDEITIQ